jgi:molecular chaperone GrpE
MLMPDETSKTVEESQEASPPTDLQLERQKNEELLSRLKHLQADFENYRKRISRETEDVVKFANEALVLRLLPVLDDFDAALSQLDEEASEGVRMVRDNFFDVLRSAGVEEIPAEGRAFDPYLHDCVQQAADSDLTEGSVKEVVRKGYRLQDRILRPAQVVVVKNGGELNA